MNQRRQLNQMKAGHCPAPVREALMKLQQWLAINPNPSEATVKAFPLCAEVHMVYPANKGKDARMAELRTLTNTP
ncbi:MAG: hypothetical protein JNL05_13070 [Flavobacteriales bacterium]|nr:hypothetical protein [Flavobacteriales bacterium]